MCACVWVSVRVCVYVHMHVCVCVCMRMLCACVYVHVSSYALTWKFNIISVSGVGSQSCTSGCLSLDNIKKAKETIATLGHLIPSGAPNVGTTSSMVPPPQSTGMPPPRYQVPPKQGFQESLWFKVNQMVQVQWAPAVGMLQVSLVC